nr:PREDICTED: probable cytochrome P450 6d4 [Bemisia tabaci]
MGSLVELLSSFGSPSLNSVLIVASVGLLAWYYLEDKVAYWSKRGVPNVPASKCIAQTLTFLAGRKTMNEIFKEQYQLLEGQKYGGTFQGLYPSILVRDPAMIKEWLVKSFSSFHDRAPEPDENVDKLAGNLFQLTGDRWRTVRHKLSPAFSSAKLKIMYETLKDCAEECNAHLEARCASKGETEIDIKDFVSNYTMDVIGACAMGIKCNAVRDPENCEMKKVVKEMFAVGWRSILFQLLEMIHPKLPELLRIVPRQPAVEQFLMTITKNAMEMKTKAGQSTRKDFLQILMNISSSESDVTRDSNEDLSVLEGGVVHEGPIFTENIIAGVVTSFLFAGLEPVSAITTFCLYELVRHPEMQERLFQEIQSARKESCGEIKYEDLKKLRYLDQVVNETFRKYPVASILARNCTENVQISGESVVVEKGVKVFISTYALHRDPTFFPDPDKFDPERFSEENVDKIIPGSYLPFGDGPRFCIAQRLALMDVKTMVITLVSGYTLHTCSKTVDHIEMDPKAFTLNPKGSVWLRLKKRI